MVSGTPCTSSKERWMDICKKSRTAFWFEHSLAISGWTGRCCPYPQGTRDCKVSNKVRAKYYYKTCWSWEWTVQVDCRCNSCLQRNLIPTREAVGTGYPTFCLCRTSPSIELRTHTHPWGSQVLTPLLAPSFTRCI